MATTTYGSPYVDGTDLVANWPAASLTVAQSIDAAGYYIGRGNNTQTASYTTVLTDAGKTVTMSNASANTVTIPANSSVAYVIGTQIRILNLGAGACTPTAGAGVTISGTISALAINQFAEVQKTATNTWSYMPGTSPSGLQLVKQQTVGTTVSSVTLTSAFSADYDIYRVIYTGGVASAGVYLTGRMATTSTGYYETRLSANIPAATLDINITNNGAEFRFGSGTTTGVRMNSIIGNPFSSQPTTNNSDAFDPSQMVYAHSILNNSTSYTDFTIFSNSGTITGGTVFVYGFSKG